MNSGTSILKIKRSMLSAKGLSTLFTFLFALILSVSVKGQSDLCSAAPSLTQNQSCVTTAYTMPASFANEIAAPCAVGTSYRDCWYKFTAVYSYSTVTATTDRPLSLGLYSGACGSLTEINCATAAAGGTATLSFNTTIGTTYYIRLAKTNNNTQVMTGNICVYETPYCTPTHTNSCTTDYINLFRFNGTTVTSGCSGAYNFFSSPTFTAPVGCPLAFFVTTGSTTYTEQLGIWIDFNGDKDFADAGERVYNGTTAAFTHSGSITIPNTATIGSTRMRVSCTYTASPSADGCGTYAYGETEDYNLTILGATVPSVPTISTATNVVCTSFTANWSAVSEASSYKIDVATDAGFTSLVPGFNNQTVSGTSTSVTGLTANTNYFYRVRAVNCYGTSASSATQPVTTDIVTNCYCAPTNSAGCANYDITNITFSNVNNSTGCSASTFTYYSALTGNVVKGCTFNLTGTVGFGSTYWNGWIDYDQDGIFEATESIFDINTSSASINQNITVPASALTGTTRIRIRVSRTTDFTTGDACLNATDAFGGETEDYNINISAAVAPSAPTSIAATDVQCNGFSANWQTLSTATSYFLDVATDAGFTSILAGYNNLNVGNVTTYYVTGLTTAATYYYRVRGTNCNGTGTSSNVTSQLTSSTCYCQPTYNQGCGTYYVSLVNVNGTSFTSGCSANQFKYTSTPTIVFNRNCQVNVNGSMNNTIGGYWAAWIDYNQNGTFEASECVHDGTTYSQTFTQNFTIPGTATLGATRLRVRMVYNTDITSAQACNNFNDYGETEDYLINIIDPTVGVTLGRTGDQCSDAAETFSLTGYSSLATYTWEKSTDGNTWTTAGTGFTFAAPAVTAATYYRARVIGACPSEIIPGTLAKHYLAPATATPASVCSGSSSSLLATYNLNNGTNSNTTSATVNGATVDASLTVANIYPLLIATNTIDQVCMSISHAANTELTINLVSPDGKILLLASNRTGANFTNTCFSSSASTNITAGGAPYSATYIPQGGDLNNGLLGGQTNGTWKLRMTDAAGGSAATFNNWSITFKTPTISWTPTTGITTSTTIANPSASPSSTTTYTANVQYPGLSCALTEPVTVTVTSLPGLATVTDTTKICSGTAATITATPPAGSTLKWYDAATGGNLVYTGNSYTTGNLTADTKFYIESVNGSCISSTRIQTYVKIRSLPVVGAGADVAICIGASANLSATGANTYSWSGGAGSTANVTVNPTTSTTYTVTGTDVNGCINTDAVQVTVNPLPTVNAGADKNMCIGAGTTLTATGASTYSWDNGAGTEASVSVNPSTNTTYTVTGTDGNGCINTDQIVITVKPLPTVDAGADKTICAGQSTSLTATGASTYSWNNGGGAGATVSVSPTSTTTYTVTGTDGFGCVNTDQAIVTVNPLPTVDAGLDVTICKNQSVNLNATASGNPALTYSWSSGQNTAAITVNPTTTTTYTVTVTDGKTCQKSDAVQVTVNPLPTVNAGADKSMCIGAGTTLTASGANTYSWDNGAGTGTTVSVNPSSNTTYTVTGTDVNGCVNTDQVIVTVNPLPTVNAGLDKTICAGQSTSLSATGASTYSWNNGGGAGASVTVSPATTTTYTVTGTDANGCVNTDQVVVTVNPLPTANAGADVTICSGQSTTLSATATGAATLSYSWSSGPTTPSITVSPTSTTTYTVTVTDGNGCQKNDAVQVTVNGLPSVNAGLDKAICIGQSTSLTATGATTYTWDNSAGSGASVTVNPTVTTTYTVTGTNGAGCSNTDQVVVTVNPLPTANAGSDVTLCAGQSTTLTATGTGAPALSYSWDNSAGNTAAVTVTPASTTTYTVTITDGNGCQKSDAVLVTINALPTANAGPDVTICNTSPTTLTATATGLATLTYSWDHSAGNTASVTVSPSTTTTYIVTVTDGNGCTKTDAVQVNVNALPSVNAGVDKTICLGQSVNLTATGATSYTWNNSAGNTATVSVSPTTTTTYTVTGTDGNGCMNSDQVVVNVNPLPTANAGLDVSICTGSSITLTANGTGTPTLSYSWDHSAGNTPAVTVNPTSTTVYTVTVTDGNGCQKTDAVQITVNPLPTVNAGADVIICNGQSTSLTATGAISYVWDNSAGNTATVSVSPSATTTYTVTGTDANGCVNTDQVKVTVNPLPAVNAGLDKTICNGQSVILTASGASSYVWDHAAGNTATVSVSPTTTTTYTVTGTSAAGCNNTDQVVVTVNPLPSVDAGANVTICSGQSTILTATGATSYVWDNAAGNTASVTVSPTSTTTYTVTGTDGNGCVNTDQVTVTVNPLPTVSAGADVTICNGQSTNLTATGATSYAWDNSAGNTSTVTVSPTITTTYTVTGTNGNGCVNTDQVKVTVNALPTVNAGIDKTICNGQSTSLTATGATSYVWNNSAGNTATVTVSPGGNTTYTVTGTDGNGCVNTDQVLVTVNPLPNVNAGIDKTICNGQSTTLTATGATSYVWDHAAGNTASVTVSPTSTTTYTVTGTDVNGCINTDQVTVNVNALPTVSAGSDVAICTGQSTTLTASGATSYVWDHSAGNTASVSVNPSSTTTYTVTGTDANGCVNTDQVVVTVNSLPSVNAGPDVAICIGASTNLTASGSVSYSWDNGAGNTATVTVNPGSTTTYTVTGTSGVGCTATDQVKVTVNPLPVIDAGADVAICPGTSTTLTASGASSYSWSNAAGNTASVIVTPASTTTYTVTGTDGNGCVNTDQVKVTVNPAAVVSAGPDVAICIGASTTLTASGVSSYNWSHSAGNTASVTVTPSATTTYTVTGTDLNGCIATDQVKVTVNPLPTVSAGADVTICEGATTTLTASGASSYVWDNSAGNTASVSVNPTVNTTYTVTGTDINGCVNTDPVVVTVNPLPTANAGPDVEICKGQSVTLTGSGTGAGTLGYVWDSGAATGTTYTVSPTTITTYNLTLTDGNGCSKTDQVTVGVNNLPTVDAGLDQTVCNGASATLTASGALSYVWDNGAGNTASVTVTPSVTTTYTVIGTDPKGCTNSDQVTVSVNNLPSVSAGPDQAICIGQSAILTASGSSTYAWDNGAGNTATVTVSPTVTTTYTVTGTSGAGCSATDQITITVNSLPTINAGLDQAICAGQSATLTASGANTYSWNNGIGAGNPVTAAPAGTTTYTVTGTDLNGCSNTDQVKVIVNPLPVVNAGTDVAICIGGSTILTASGATSYSWDNTAGNTASVTVTPTSTTTYTVTGTDANGCVNTDQVKVTVNPLPMVNAGTDVAICIGGSSTLTASGATSYVWDNSAGNTASVTVNPTSTTTYTVTGTDGNGCVNTDQVKVNVNPLPTVTAGADVAICVGQSTTLNAGGATSYVWDNSAGNTASVTVNPTSTTTYTVTGTDANGCVNSDMVTVTVNPLPAVTAGADIAICIGGSTTLSAGGASSYVWDNSAGNTASVTVTPSSTTTYTVTGTDANGCVNTDQVIVTVNPLPIVNAGTDVAICIGGSTTLTASGASSYTWDNAAGNTASVIVNPASTTNYTVTGTDGNGCVNTDQVKVSVNPLPIVTAGADVAICAGQSTTLNAGGAISYVWDNSAGNMSSVTVTPSSTTTYTVTGTDANGCVNTDQVKVTVNPLPSVTAGADVAICIGGSTTLTASGAASYVWNNAAGNTSSVTVTPSSTTTYTVTGTDMNGCVNTDQVIVTVNPLPTVDAGADIAICSGQSTTLTASGASSYAWDYSAGNTASVVVTPPSTRTYTVTGTDVNGCVNTDQVTVTVNTLPVVSAGPDQAICFGQSATLTASGAISYTWDNSAGNTASVIVSPTVTTTYTVTGDNGCTATDAVVVTVNPLPAQPTVAATSICSGTTSTLTATAPGGSYKWYDALSGGNLVNTGTTFTTPVLNNPTQTPTTQSYFITTTDAKGCVSSPRTQVDITIKSIPPAPTVSSPVATCSGDPITVSGTAADQIDWWTKATSGIIFNANNNTYTTSALTADSTYYLSSIRNGCYSATRSALLVQAITRPVLNSITNKSICTGSSVNETLSSTPSSGVSYTWTSSVISGSASGNTASGSGASINDVLSNSGTLPAVVRYTANIISTGTPACTGNSISFDITVNPVYSSSISGATAICEGSSTTLTASSAQAGVSFNWYDAASAGNLLYTGANYLVNPTTSTNYFVDATLNGCAGPRVSHSLTVTPIPSIDQPADEFFCKNGALNVPLYGNPSGAVNYSWTSSVISGSASGNTSNPSTPVGSIFDALTNNGVTVAKVRYTVSAITQAAPGCVSPTKTFDVTINPAFTITPTITNVTCFGYTDGAITMNTGGAVAPVTYEWTGVSAMDQYSQTADSLAPGSYTVIVKDAGGCAVSGTYSTQPANDINITATINNVKCFGQQTGAIVTNVTNATGTVNYSWSNLEQTPHIFNLDAGPYTVNIEDSKGCKKSASFTVNGPAAALDITETISNVNCNGASTGAINTIVSGGTSPYTYSWTGGAITPGISNKAAGNYTLTVKDANNCAYSESYVITQPATPVSGTAVTTDVNCNGASTGAINLSPVGGTPSYTFTWNDLNTDEDRSGLTAGNYSVDITDNNGCTVNRSFVVKENPAITATLVAKQFNGGNNISCYGYADGEIDLTPAGGVTPYVYNWSNAKTTQDITGLTAGNYTVEVSDRFGCSSTFTADLTEPAVFTHTTTVKEYLGGYQISCNGKNDGEVDMQLQGGVSPFSYSIGSQSIPAFPKSGLTAGTYTVRATDANGCATSSLITLVEPIVLKATTTPSLYNGGYNITCFGRTDGNIVSTVSGGTPGYSYSWNTGPSTPDLNNIGTGLYKLSVTDANGCIAKVNTPMYEPAQLTTTITPSMYNGNVNISCFGGNNGSIGTTVIGGTQPFDFNWNGVTSTKDISNLSAGQYDLVITDDNGCSFNIGTKLTEPTQLVNSFTLSDYNGYEISCNGSSDGSLSTNVTGGFGPYTYKWDSNETTSGVTGKQAGPHTVEIKDANGCILTESAMLNQPAALAITSTLSNYNGENISCFGLSDGSINLSTTGGVGTYHFTWSSSLPDQSSQIGIPAGTYTTTVNDANGCKATVTNTLTQAPQVTVSTVIDKTIQCFGDLKGQISATPGGGIAPYTFQWQNSSSAIVSTGATATGLGADSYSVTVTDKNGCKATETSINLNQPSALTVSTSGTDLTCYKDFSGSVSATATGGTSGYSYNWTGGPFTSTWSGIAAGNYQVTVRDGNNCTATKTQAITEPTEIMINTVAQNLISCDGKPSGSVSTAVSGGTSPYTLLWSNNKTSNNISNLLPGTYVLTVTDKNNCKMTGAYNVTQVNTPDPGFTFMIPDCGADKLLVLANTNVGGSGLAVISGDATVNAINDTTFEVTAPQYGRIILKRETSISGCTSSIKDTIDFRPIPPVSFVYSKPEKLTVLDNRVSLVNTSADPVYGTATYSWSLAGNDLSSEPSYELLMPDTGAGTYDVCLMATSELGCTAISCEQITVEGLAILYLANTFTPDGDGFNDTYKIATQGIDPQHFSFRVFDRGGQVIFESTDPHFEWTGIGKSGVIQDGVYVFELSYITDYAVGVQHRSGTINIIK